MCNYTLIWEYDNLWPYLRDPRDGRPRAKRGVTGRVSGEWEVERSETFRRSNWEQRDP